MVNRLDLCITKRKKSPRRNTRVPLSRQGPKGIQPEELVERVTIQEASHRLNLSQADVRECIRKEELRAVREPGPRGQRWMVELPEDGWESSFKASLRELSQQITPWWWPTEAMTGHVHYVQDLGIEEIEPLYLCGLRGDNVWDARRHTEEDRCPTCLEIAMQRGLPLWSQK